MPASPTTIWLGWWPGIRTGSAGFAALPTQDPKAAAEELDRCIHELGFCGALVNDHFGGHYLDEPQYEEIWAALEDLSVPLYLHPGIPAFRPPTGSCSTAAPS